MLNNLKPQAPDKIIALIAAFKADPRPGKIDLGVGVYKDASGLTPVMRAVKAAERKIWEGQTSKTYTALAGEPEYHAAMAGLILGADYPRERLAALATVGGTGAIRQALELVQLANPGVQVHVSDPTWPNHLSILTYLGIPTFGYRYFDAETRGVDFAAMLKDLGRAKAGDVVLLHGCCHNPTGANLSADQWHQVADLLAKTGALPLVDLAYQGFGDGLDADAEGTRILAARLPQVLIAASCSKNFGIYRERTGILLALTDPAIRDVVQANMAQLNRLNYSFAPDHGARVVTEVLTDPALRADWEAELEEIRSGMLALREQLARELRDRAGSDRFGFIAEHRGMFSRLGATPAQVEALRAEAGIYMVGDSRLNIAGLNRDTVPKLAQAIIAAGI